MAMPPYKKYFVMDKVYFHFSKTVKIVTAIVSILLILTICMAFNDVVGIFDRVMSSHDTLDVFLSVFVLLVVAFLAFILLYIIINIPIYYKRDEKGLYLKKLVGSKYFSFDEYTIEDDFNINFNGFIRAFASGGFFGYIGKFYSRRFGICDFYLTNENKEVISLVKKSSGKYTFISKK